jgi:hypothetical protein
MMSDVDVWAPIALSKMLGGITMRALSILIAAGAVLSVSSIFTPTEAATRTTVISSDPPRYSTTANQHRSSIAKKRGANAYGFCPPGQAKKPGRGSAFRC